MKKTFGAIVAFCVLAIVTAVLVGCGSGEESGVVYPIAPAVRPAEPNLTTPEDAVESYTDWISYAYRVMDSEVATHAFSLYEEVNVNSYVQYNAMEGKGLEQFLQRSDYDLVAASDTTATIVGDEYWLYRYFAADQSKYLTSPKEASYEVTYTVVHQDDGRWLVDKVEVTRLDGAAETTRQAEPAPE